MKRCRVLGILWLALCSYFGFDLLWGVSPIFYERNVVFTRDLYIGIFLCAVYLSGIVPCIFLFRGAEWAQVFVGVLAVVSFMACFALFFVAKRFPFPLYLLAAFALLSAGLLLFPKRRVA